MNLLIDNHDGRGLVDYSAYVDRSQPPKIARKLNQPEQMTAWLLAADSTFSPPASGARVILQRSDGYRLFTGYLTAAPMQQYLGYAQGGAAWQYALQASDDGWLLDRNAIPVRAPFANRMAGDALRTLANDVLPGVLDVSGVQNLSALYQYATNAQKPWAGHAQEISRMARGYYRVHDGQLSLQEVGSPSFTLNEQDATFAPASLSVVQSDELRNDVTVIGELEPVLYVRDYFLGDGATLGFYLSETPYSKKAATILQEDYSETSLSPTLWQLADPNHKLSIAGGSLWANGGPVTLSFVEQVELGGGLLMQHGQICFNGATTGTIGGLYNGAVTNSNCLAGFSISPSGANCTIQALVNGAAAGTALNTTPGHQYAFATQIFCQEAHREHASYQSSAHPAGSGRWGDSVAALLRVVLSVHDVDPTNPATIATAATVLFDDVLAAPPSFATYALLNASSAFLSIAFTQIEQTVDAGVRSMIPGQAFRTRVAGGLCNGGECYINSSGELRFYPPYPPQPNEQIVVTYRSSARAMARMQDPASIAAHISGSDNGRRSFVRRLKLPLAPSSADCENAALAILDDSVQPAWAGEYAVVSDFLPASDVLPGYGVNVAAPSRGAAFTAIVRECDVQVVEFDDDRSHYVIRFANDAAQALALEFESMTLPEPLKMIEATTTPSSSLFIPNLANAQITGVTSTQISVDAGVPPAAGGGIEVRRSDAGWGCGNNGNLVGRFATQTFNLPRLSRVQAYYLRQYDASSPAKYSRYSALLYTDYPL